MEQGQKINVYYDGLCRVCAAEISLYQKLDQGRKINFLDITAKQFDPIKEGLDPYLVHKELHCKDENGKLYIGVQGFVLIWSRLDRFKWAARLAHNPIIRKILEFGYALFIRIRPFLPRKKCDDSPFCERK